MSILQEFKKFAMRGNVVDLAVAVVMGASFGKIISSLVDGVIMPLIGVILGGIDISNEVFTFNQTTVKWGLFLQSIIDFSIIAFSIFVVIKLLNQFQQKEEMKDVEVKEEIKLLTEIRDLLKRNVS